MAYLYIKNPVVFRAKFFCRLEDIKHGYKGAGMPLWWDKFSKTYYSVFIRIVGSMCVIITRAFIPNFPRVDEFIKSIPGLASFILIMCLILFRYTTVFAACNVWSAIKYLIKGQFIKSNPPVNVTASVSRGLISTSKALGWRVGGIGTLAGTIQAIDYTQTKVLNASDHQLLTSHLRKGVDVIKDQIWFKTKILVQQFLHWLQLMHLNLVKFRVILI